MKNLEILNHKKSIIFIDIDETIFKTYAKIYVRKKGEIIKKLSNTEFNNYQLKEGESFDFKEFRDGKLFKETSKPINANIKYIKKIIDIIKRKENDSKIIFLTAREDFLDKQKFLDKFREQGFEIDNKNLMYIERAGNLKQKTIAENKKKCIKKYLEKGKYNFVKIIDDDEKNIKILKEIAKEIPQTFLKELEKEHKPQKDEPLLIFQGYLAKHTGKIELIFQEEIYN